LSAGALAYIIACIIEGQDIEASIENALTELKKYDGNEECTNALKLAVKLSKSSLSDVDAISQLGEGWVGEEALGISAYCTLKYQNDFKRALIAAVNHDGDSDSTGAITGNILGAHLGLARIPAEWVETVELKEVTMQIADDLLLKHQKGDEWWDRYPG